MDNRYTYYAFISYKREDEKWAKWLQDRLEHYSFPSNLNGKTVLPKNIRPTFRDVTDLNPGLLADEIDKALRDSEWLIVVCSPRSARSPWVCKEARTFIDMGRAEFIIPFIIEGTPFSDDISNECYPDAIRSLKGHQELLGASVNEMGREAAYIKVIARMFGLRFDSLWQRHQRELRRRHRLITGVLLAVLILTIGTILYIWGRYRDVQRNESLYLSEKAIALIEKGDTEKAIALSLSALPTSRSILSRPYVANAERSLRMAYYAHGNILESKQDVYTSLALSPDNKMLAIGGGSAIDGSSIGIISLFDTESLQLIDTLVIKGHGRIHTLAFSKDGEKIVAGTLGGYLGIFDILLHELDTLQNDVWAIRKAEFSGDDKVVFAQTVQYISTSHQPFRDTSLFSKIIELRYTDRIRHVLAKSDRIYTSLSVSKSNNRIVAGIDNGTIHEIDLSSGCKVQEHYDQSNHINQVNFAPDRKNLYVSAGGTGIATLWRFGTGKSYLSKTMGEAALTSARICFINEKPSLVASTADGCIIILEDFTTNSNRHTLKSHSDVVQDAILLPNGKIISASWDGTARVWNSLEHPKRIINTCNQPATSPVDSALSGRIKGSALKILDTSLWGRYQLIENESCVTALDRWTGRTMLDSLRLDRIEWGIFTLNPKVAILASKKNLFLVDVTNGYQVQESRSYNKSAFFRHNSYNVYYWGYNELVSWNLITGQNDTLFRIVQRSSYTSFDQKGKYAYYMSNDKMYKIRLRDGRVVGQDYWLSCSSSDGRLYAEYQKDSSSTSPVHYVLKVFDNKTRELIWEEDNHHQFDEMIDNVHADYVLSGMQVADNQLPSLRFDNNDHNIVLNISDTESYVWDFTSLNEILDCVKNQ